jgi:hypothetical protein
VVRGEHAAEVIWRRWQVGPHQWQVKHLRWYLEHRTVSMKPSTRYRHWLTVRALVYALGRSDDWLPRLRGDWIRPTGDDRELQVGRDRRACRVSASAPRKAHREIPGGDARSQSEPSA